MKNKIEVLQNSRIDGRVLKLPSIQLSREVYLEVKKSLELIGGKWTSGKVQGFVFEEDPTDLIDELINGKNRNIKKEFQFFATPNKLADKLVFIANPNSNAKILEPSAGQGAIIKAINRAIGDVTVDCYELMPLNQKYLAKIPTANLIGDDFLLSDSKNKYDVIIANPPFSKNQDIDHVYKMFDALKPKGKMVAIISNHWKNSSNKKELAFGRWLKDNDAQLFDVPNGTFKESGTEIATTIIKILKLAQANLVKIAQAKLLLAKARLKLALI